MLLRPLPTVGHFHQPRFVITMHWGNKNNGDCRSQLGIGVGFCAICPGLQRSAPFFFARCTSMFSSKLSDKHEITDDAITQPGLIPWLPTSGPPTLNRNQNIVNCSAKYWYYSTMSSESNESALEKGNAATADTTDLETTAPKGIGPEGLDAIRVLLKSQAADGQEQPKRISVSFRDVSVTAPSGSQINVKTLPQAIINTFGPDQIRFFKEQILSRITTNAAKPSGRTILDSLTGIVKPGEMLLVLGRPGSGCSTFLRTIANQSTLATTGDLEYGGIAAPVFKSQHARETIYLPEEDKHIASLTVRQTIQFALRNCLPSRARDTKLISDLVDAIAKICGLSHALETPVGGAFSPGVSGGERKRVSIAEVLAAGSSVQCFDNSTRGLDSSTALDFVKALRAFTDIANKTTLATLYQAGEQLYRHFDKVIVLSEGHEAFFGSTSEARDYFQDLGFVSLPGQTTAEYLATVTDPEERTVVPGSEAEKIKSSADLAAVFRKSDHYKRLVTDIDEYQEKQGRAGALLPSDSYRLPLFLQVKESLTREYHLVQGQRRVYYIKWITTIILCLVCGSVYFDIESNAQGAFTRGGILYFALILNGWLQFPELFDAYTNRPVLERQANLHLTRPAAVAIARFLIDLPLIAFQHVLFTLVFYFLSRLQVEAGKFFFFYLTLFISTVCFSNLLRMFAYFVGTLDDCFRYGGFSCTVLLLFAGFLIPPKDMKPAFGWLHHINPMFYGFENLFTSEFSGLDLSCDGNLIPAYGVSGHQTCAVRGALPGQTNVPGSQYAESFGFSSSHRWRNIGIMIAIAVVYLSAGVFGSEVMRFAPQGGAPLVFAKRRDHTAKSRLDDVEKSAPASGSSSASRQSHILSGRIGELALKWKNISVDIGDNHILSSISGYVRRGELTALCGASGAGKTTLLTALSQTNFAGRLVGGQILVGSQPPSSSYRKRVGFAQQMDLHDGTATVREALEFSALLRQPQHYSRAEKLDYVDKILELLDLNDVQDALIGEDGGGLGVERLKRVTIGVELAARPEILFADEPTSGLDSQGAARIVHYLKLLARQGQAIVVTIHQPSALLFSQFDNLLALSSQGRQLYFGKVTEALPYFARNGAVCPDGANPGEFILETVGAGVDARTNDKGSNWAATWAKSEEATLLEQQIESSNNTDTSGFTSEEDNATSEYNASLLTQTLLLTKRMLLNQWRNPPYIYSKIWVHVISAILVGFTFFQIGTSPQDLQNRMFSVFFILFLCNAIVNVILARYFFPSLYWQFREGPSHAYGWVAFVSSTILSELPGAVLVTVLYFVLWYFPSGLPLGQAGYIFLFLLTYEIFQVLLGLFMVALSPDLGAAGNVLVFIVCTCNWFNGIIVPYSQIQVFWRYWLMRSCNKLYYLSPFTYLLGGMVTAVTSSVDLSCSSSDLTVFTAPSNETCFSYASEWARSASAQLLNPDASGDTLCQVCRWDTGKQFLNQFNLGDGQLGGQWGSWGIFVIFTVSNFALVYFFTWATKVKGWKLFYFF
ncbi:ATP-binding protein multidrug cassette transport [Fusarium beomiforme]|uniref:ATP-binding protein multidrug cassette transport n=1 Tax=Fusarium beomiforme TaxID=44412 RepID=A0A9P5A943_9HYPO|nr:ATP-binding protein multidrug cassette transport [Fusarium beomiforme]